MRSVGIITIHKINNYGSVLQAYALQRVCEDLGYEVEIIDYNFPNEAHINNPYAIDGVDIAPNEPQWIKALFARALIRQHKGIATFINKYQHLSPTCYTSPNSLSRNPPIYDIYITGSDQLWSPRYCNGDTAFMLSFAPDNATKISYAVSFGTNNIPDTLKSLFEKYLTRYSDIAVRENSGYDLVKALTGKDAAVVLDPTLLLNSTQWNKIAAPHRLIKRKYILCYFLNYSFNAFPYVDALAKEMQIQTGYEIVSVARPPHKLMLKNRIYRVGASPEEFIALIRDAELVLTTSFHGTAFAVNYGRPVFTVVKNQNAEDSRQVSLMSNLGLHHQILEIETPFPKAETAKYNILAEQQKLDELRLRSLSYLKKALRRWTL